MKSLFAKSLLAKPLFATPIKKKAKTWTGCCMLALCVASLSGWGHAAETTASLNVQTPRLEVSVMAIERRLQRRQLQVFGEVTAHQISDLGSRVAALVMTLEPAFEAGQFVRRGQLLATLDATDYQLALAQAQQGLSEARVQLLQQQAASDNARQDWFSNNQTAPDPLAIQQPQLQAAKALLLTAEQAVKQAKVELAATQVRAPFDGWLLSRAISVGNWVSRGSALGQLQSADQLLVNLPLSSAQANSLADYAADVELQLRDGQRRWSMKGLTLAAQRDQQARQVMAQGYYRQRDDSAHLKPGTYVQATLEWGQSRALFAIPTVALSQRRTVFILSEGTLQELTPELVYRNGDQWLVDLPGANTLHLVVEYVNRLWAGALAINSGAIAGDTDPPAMAVRSENRRQPSSVADRSKSL